MKKKNLIMVLTLTLALGVGATAYADSVTNTPNTNNTTVASQGAGFRAITGTRGYDFMINLLQGKFGIGETEITEGRAAGKTIFEIASEKGVTPEDFKATMLEEKINSIDEAITNGSVTKEQGEALKARIEENSATCTTPGEGQGRSGSARMGQGNGSGEGMGKGAGMRGANRGACGNLGATNNN
ncbi:hypothetical protein [Clostridium sp.]|uniref:hypothetical protein n=1 Tax=Clostridium sp. TaxID=1506 RepID=UPI002FC75EDA